ncbi:MAG: restriction endonuclease subunit S [Bacteroidales bacterium]|nr:restriction endonuclease subunit S [Bacteroidales bacterium]
MNHNWTYKKLGEVCDVLDSKRKPITKCDRQSGNIPYYGATGIQDYVKDYIFDGRYLLVGEDGAKWGKNDNTAYIIEGKSWVNNHAHILKMHDDAIDAYVRYFLNGKDLNCYITGAIVQKLTQAALVNIPIPLPPLETQSRIVAELDLLQAIIDKQKAQLAELDNLAQCIFYDMFGDPVENDKGWEVKKLWEIVSEDCPISYGIVQPGDGVDNGIPVVRPVDMTHTFVYRQGLKQTTKEISNSYKRTILKGNEILLCVRGTTGLVSLATDELKGCNVTRGVTPIECNVQNDRWFVYFQFLTNAVQQHIAEYTKGIALKQINMKDVREIPFIVPPLSLQQSFAAKIESIEKQKAAISKSIAETEKLFEYSMDKYIG